MSKQYGPGRGPLARAKRHDRRARGPQSQQPPAHGRRPRGPLRRHPLPRARGAGAGISLVLATLETGRTHQIRVHFAYKNRPVVGDVLYGPKKPKGLRPEPPFPARRLQPGLLPARRPRMAHLGGAPAA